MKNRGSKSDMILTYKIVCILEMIEFSTYVY